MAGFTFPIAKIIYRSGGATAMDRVFKEEPNPDDASEQGINAASA